MVALGGSTLVPAMLTVWIVGLCLYLSPMGPAALPTISLDAPVFPCPVLCQVHAFPPQDETCLVTF